MGLVDSIIGVESGGNPNARFREVICPPYIRAKLWIVGIVELLFVSCPATVSRFIADLRVNAVNGVLGGGLFSHVGKKVFKAASPSIANLDALGPVIFETDVCRSRASFLHRAPSSILCGFLQAVGFHCCAHHLPLKTSATLCPRRSQAILANNRNVSAVTRAAIAAYAACAATVRVPLRIDFKINDKSSDSLARKVYHGS